MLNVLEGSLLDDTMQNEIVLGYCITSYISQRHIDFENDDINTTF